MNANVSALLVCAGDHTCALRLSHVVEVMRALPVEALAGAPEMVLGLAVIRGNPVPVVHLGSLFHSESGACGRFVVVRAGERRVALAVDAIVGIRAFDPAAFGGMPPLLREAAKSAVETVGALDSELLFVLNTAGIVPRELLEEAPGLERR